MLGQVWLNRHSIFSPDRPGDESIPARSTRHMWARHVAAERAPSLRLNWFIPWGDGQMELTFHPRGWGGGGGGGGGRQLLTLRERGSSPLAWLDEYKLTYSPSPPSSFALSLYEKRGGTQTGAWSGREGQQAPSLRGAADVKVCLCGQGLPPCDHQGAPWL